MLSQEEAARLLGMKTREVVSVAESDDGYVVSLHDGTAMKFEVEPEPGPIVITREELLEGHTQPEPEPTLGEQVTDALIADVPNGTVNDVLDWVDGDPERALQALVVEQESDKPRSTLMAKLEELMSQ